MLFQDLTFIMRKNLLNSKKGKEKLVVKVEPTEPLQPPTIEEFMEGVLKYPGSFQTMYHLPDDAQLIEFFEYFEWYKSRELSRAEKERIVQGYVIMENFVADWRKGQEIHKVVITQRLYQISSTSTQA